VGDPAIRWRQLAHAGGELIFNDSPIPTTKRIGAMVEHLKEIVLSMPFMLAAGVQQPKFSVQRITEALVIAIITAVATSYMTVQKIDIKQDQAQKQFEDQVKRRNEEIATIKAEMRESNLIRSTQYELLRTELQKIAIAMERKK